MNIPKHEPSPLTDLKPGDIITAHMKGFHEVIAVKRRFRTERDCVGASRREGGLQWLQDKKPGDEYNPLIYYRRRLNGNGNKAPNQINCCDDNYCVKVTRATIIELHTKALKAAQKIKEATELLLEEMKNDKDE